MNIIIVISNIKVFILLHFHAPRFLVAEHSIGTNETNKLEWKPVLPIKFHQEVMLQCEIPNCCTNTTKWIGGPEGTLLTYQKHSLNNTKYKEIWGRNVNYLIIKNFELDDVNCVYTCYHGFDFYSRNLTIDGNQFELLPTKDTIKKELKLSEGQVEVNIELLEVYPKPECMIFLGKKDISNQLFRHEQKELLSFFYKVKYYLKYEVCTEECNDNLTMTCLIGSQNIPVLDSYLVLQTRSCSNLILFSYFLLMWISFLWFGLCLLVIRRCRFSDYHCKIEWLRYSVPVVTAVSLILVILGVVAFIVGDNCKITSVQMNDLMNRQFAVIAVSLAAIFTLFSVVILIVLYKSRIRITGQDKDQLCIISCLIYWCYPCSNSHRKHAPTPSGERERSAHFSTGESIEVKLDLTGEHEPDLEL